MATLTKDSIYVGTDLRARERFHVLGWQFGPCLLVANATLEEAIDEWDERHGQRVNFDADHATLLDYAPNAGASVEECVEAAMACGDIRVNDGGTMVWVDHYEWCRSFQSGLDAARYFRSC